MASPLTSFALPRGTYTSLGGNLLTRTRDALSANLTNLLNLIPTPTIAGEGVAVNRAPDFDLMHPATAAKLRLEIQTLIDECCSKTGTALSPV